MGTKIVRKLREVKTGEYEKWLKEHCVDADEDCKNCFFGIVMCNPDNRNCWIKHKNIYNDNFLNKEIEVEIACLDCEEKKYLSEVIKPFRDRVISISKHSFDKNLCFISIVIEPKEEIKRMLLEGEREQILLPLFKKDSLMYQGLELEKKYTLEDLEL